MNRSVFVLLGVGLGLVVPAAVAQPCVWEPWMAPWGHLDDYDPAGDDFDPSNWDTAGLEPTVLAGDGRARTGDYALHFFSGNPSDPGNPDGQGSGGVFQEIIAERGTPIDVEVAWKGVSQSSTSGGWFEILVVEGTFTPGKADSAVDPVDIILKYDTFPGGPPPPPSTWKKDNVTWNNWSSTTPAQPTTVTVILKAGTVGNGPSFFEVYFDDVTVRQSGGPNMLTNGDFEDENQVTVCDALTMDKDPSRENYYFGNVPPETCDNGIDDDGNGLADCGDPACSAELFCRCNFEIFADIDQDGDVDQFDFAVFQLCLTGSEPDHPPIPVDPELCLCFDLDGDETVGGNELAAFEACASGPTVAAEPDCDN